MSLRKKAFRVKLTGRAGLVYEEAGKSLGVDSEMLAGPRFDIVIYENSIKHWQPPHENEALSEHEKARIKGNIIKEPKRLRIDWA